MPFLLILMLLFSSCDKQAQDNVSKRQIEASTIRENRFDPTILQIEENSRGTLTSFFRNLNRAASEKNNFFVKYPFLAEPDSSIRTEQLWLSNISYENGDYYGIVANTPQKISGISKGSKVVFFTDFITDWMYIQNGKIIGGQSIKYLLEKIPKNELDFQQEKILQMFN
ncbi:MAG: DUF2314 domain-containing protein [Treponema sp.]|nr:DUF2314 domain-containing protein [Treponema sp.]